ncbi:MAG: hypothetical protein U0Z17_02125 [Bacteroidales bacterium]
MKRYYLIFIMLLGAACSWGQTQHDMTAILQKCIDLPELQPYIPIDKNGKPDEVYINYWAPTIFSIDLNVSKNGERLKFLPMSQASPSFENAFFLFKNCEITPTFAIVFYEYTYDYKTQPKVIELKLTLQKVNEVWEVSETQVNSRN